MAEIFLVMKVAALLQLSNTILTNCIDYVDKVKNASTDINKMINEVAGLEFILKQLSVLASDENDSRLASLKYLHSLPAGPFQGCAESLSEIAKKLEKISGGSGIRRRLMWPFESGKM